jgi:hypothetical protein
MQAKIPRLPPSLQPSSRLRHDTESFGGQVARDDNIYTELLMNSDLIKKSERENVKFKISLLSEPACRQAGGSEFSLQYFEALEKYLVRKLERESGFIFNFTFASEDLVIQILKVT